MTRSSRKSTRSRGAAKPLPSWVWLLTGLAIGLCATFLPRITELLTSSPQIKKPVKQTNNTVTPSQRKFDFYTLLPELEVVVPADDAGSAKKPAEQLTDVDKILYVLQVGSFEQYKEADALKASLALLGIETNIEKVIVNGQAWHRVRVGPSSDKNRILSVRQQLSAQRVDSVLLQIRN